MAQSVKLTREFISRHTEKRVSKNIERWLDQHSDELKMVDDVYSLSQVLALMWRDRKKQVGDSAYAPSPYEGFSVCWGCD